MHEWVTAIERAARGEDPIPTSSLTPAPTPESPVSPTPAVAPGSTSRDLNAATSTHSKKKKSATTAADFLFGRTLGEGAYAKVVLAQVVFYFSVLAENYLSDAFPLSASILAKHMQ